MDRGYVAIWRKIQDHVFYKEKREYSKLEAWVDILMEAQHCESEKDVVIKMKLFKCGYGESLKSIRTWGARWGWGGAKVKRFFDLLVKMNQIRYKNETVTTRITVLNYSSYDPKRNSYETRPKHDRNTTETRPKTDKNVKKEKNGKNDILSDSPESDQEEKQFKKPSIEEITIYCQERKNRVDPDKFFNFYESKGWMIGKNKMKSWRSAIITWEKGDNGKVGYQNNESTPFYHRAEAPEGYK